MDSEQFSWWIAVFESDFEERWLQTATIACAAHNAAVICSMADNKDKLLRKPKDFMPKYGPSDKKKRLQDRFAASVRGMEAMFGTGGRPKR